jgi:hypothetical protein
MVATSMFVMTTIATPNTIATTTANATTSNPTTTNIASMIYVGEGEKNVICLDKHNPDQVQREVSLYQREVNNRVEANNMESRKVILCGFKVNPEEGFQSQAIKLFWWYLIIAIVNVSYNC